MTKKKNRSKAAKAKVPGREPIGNVIAVEQKAEEDANNNCLQPITSGFEKEPRLLDAEPPKSEEADSDQHVGVSKESKCREDIKSAAGDLSKTDKDGEVGNLGDKRNDECVHEDPSKDDGMVSTSVGEEVEQTAPEKNEGLVLEADAGLVLEAGEGKDSKMEIDSSKPVGDDNSKSHLEKVESNIEMRNKPSKPGNDAGTGELGLSEEDNRESKTGNDGGPSENTLPQKEIEKANSGNDGGPIEKTLSQKESEKAKPSTAQSGSCSKKEKEKGSSELNKGCSLCGREIVGLVGCKKCKTLLCHSCLPLHIFRARCLPWRVEKGKLVATRDIKPLEVVIVDRAVVTVPMGGKVTCVGCAREVNLSYLCPLCSLPLCGTACPRAQNHKIECDLLSKYPTMPSPTSEDDVNHPIFPAVGVIRILDMKRERPHDWARISSLPCKIDSLKSSQSINSSLEKVQELLQPVGFDKEEVEKAFCLIRLHGYNLHDLPDGKVRSVFPLQSRLSHSCLPSLQYIEREGGRHIVLQAVKSISKGEALTVRYTPFLQGRIGLTRWLREERFTTCTCARCLDGTELGTFTSSALCPKTECREQGGLLLPVDPQTLATDWICSSCQELTKSTSVEGLEESYVHRFSHMPKGDLNSYYRFLNELGERFHASHHLVMRMAQFLVTLQGKCLESLPIERIETQSLLCEKLIAYASRLDPGATQNRAKLLLEKNKADLNLAKLECEAGKITRKVFMAKIKEGVKVEINAKKILYFKWDEEAELN